MPPVSPCVPPEFPGLEEAYAFVKYGLSTLPFVEVGAKGIDEERVGAGGVDEEGAESFVKEEVRGAGRSAGGVDELGGRGLFIEAAKES